MNGSSIRPQVPGAIGAGGGEAEEDKLKLIQQQLFRNYEKASNLNP
jgi:hypothetical protein